ncbi:hypothetical protein BC939DRAFT_501437 [Gamsiella multidivaricata]|uniref:uncharacterized protein n=1 Tax=Gamsiella multidivaricata TaxID=101098 RepID=UPI0022208BF9|nr:uncharacterized protein BC939DRAFT_501437 [Gamsiella multidivaricata]KAG0365032.1 M-phase phosphoprotein 6 [Gamsiella multidivaricata]KAI7827104.1 hypothetical protein BC939DRAFT_501437 [Gamsiella multidivaricata]
MAEIPHKKALSGKLMTMKFMQRQQERETREKLEQEQVRVISEAHWVIDQKAFDLPKPKFQVEYEPSFLQMDAAERSSVGRVSFQKFNQNVEKTAQKATGEQQLERELKRERQAEIGDDEMAEELGRGQKPKKAKSSSSSPMPSGNRISAPKEHKTNRRAPPPKKSSQPGTPNGQQQRTFMKPKE